MREMRFIAPHAVLLLAFPDWELQRHEFTPRPGLPQVQAVTHRRGKARADIQHPPPPRIRLASCAAWARPSSWRLAEVDYPPRMVYRAQRRFRAIARRALPLAPTSRTA